MSCLFRSKGNPRNCRTQIAMRSFVGCRLWLYRCGISKWIQYRL